MKYVEVVAYAKEPVDANWLRAYLKSVGYDAAHYVGSMHEAREVLRNWTKQGVMRARPEGAHTVRVTDRDMHEAIKGYMIRTAREQGFYWRAGT